MEQINWRWRHFDTMSAAAWHDILMLRADVFVVEQACAYKDPGLYKRRLAQRRTRQRAA